MKIWNKIATTFRPGPTLRRINLKTEFSLWKRIKCFPFTLRQRNLKKQQSPVILYLCLRKTRTFKSHIIVMSSFSKTSFSLKMSSVHTKTQIPPVWRSVLRKLPFWRRSSVDGRPNRQVEIKRRFQILRRSVDGASGDFVQWRNYYKYMWSRWRITCSNTSVSYMVQQSRNAPCSLACQLNPHSLIVNVLFYRAKHTVDISRKPASENKFSV